MVADMARVFLFTLLLGHLCVLSQGKIPLYMGGFFPLSGPGSIEGQKSLPGVQFAIDLANNRSDILTDYELVLLWNDTQSSAPESMKILFDFLYTGPKKIMLLGPVLPKMAAPVAEAAAGWNLLQMSFGPRTPDLNCRSRFPYFYRTMGPDEVFNPAKAALFDHYGWKRVACLYQEHKADIYSKATADFIRLWEGEGGNRTIIASRSVDDPAAALDELKRLDARIIVANIFSDKAKEVFCEAYKRGMYGSKYVWVMLGWVGSDWWNNTLPVVSCTTEQIKEAAGKVMTFDFMHAYGGSHEAFDVTPEEFEAHIRPRSPFCANYASYAFDGAMSLVLTLDQAAREGVALETFCYTNASYVQAFVNILKTLEFEGMTGTVAFDKYGNRMETSAIMQMQGGVQKYVARYCPFKKKLYLEGEADPSWCSSGKVPKDGVTRERRRVLLPRPAFLIFLCMGVAGILMCVAFLVFNYRHRGLKYIKLSSPKMNNVALCGCVLGYVGLILNGVDGRYLSKPNISVICNLRVMVLSVAFTVAFGALFTKTWRVHQIMTSKLVVGRRVMKDVYLMSSVAGLLGVDAIIFTAWYMYDPLSQCAVNLLDWVSPTNSDHIIQPYLDICTCDHQGYWIGSLLVVKGVVLLYGLFLAWETRHITVEAINDSRYIGMCVYTVTIVCMVVVPINYLINHDSHVVLYVTSSTCIALCTTAPVCFLFLPKVYTIWKDPTGSVDMKMMSTGKVSPLETLSQQVTEQKRLEELIAEKDNRIKTLEEELSVGESFKEP